jgi:hypothetical protein
MKFAEKETYFHLSSFFPLSHAEALSSFLIPHMSRFILAWDLFKSGSKEEGEKKKKERERDAGRDVRFGILSWFAGRDLQLSLCSSDQKKLLFLLLSCMHFATRAGFTKLLENGKIGTDRIGR